MFPTLLLGSAVLTLLSTTNALAIPQSLEERNCKYPFNQLVAFGDEFSDNGNGSRAHGVTGDPEWIYGFGTWTNGPVAVSYLADMLKVPLEDFAFGGSEGAQKFGATLSNAFTKSDAGSPSLVDQIANYTTTSASNVEKSMQFIWAGQNDLMKHTDAFWLGDPRNAQFARDFSAHTTASVKTLLDAGAPYVFVSNLYPKHLTPGTSKYICTKGGKCITQWAKIIENSNAALKSSLSQFGDKVIYYDVYTFMVNLINSAPSHGFSKPLTYFCDGGPFGHFHDCMALGHADQYFWMNFVQPTARVHQMIATDMKTTIDKHFNL